MSKPRIADLFCGAGGAGMGLHRAGFEVIGFDIEPQPNYPFEFHQADALEVDLSRFDAVWASPPCQAYSVMRNLPWLANNDYPELISPVRVLLDASGLPYIIENVMGAVWKGEMQAGWLCGGMFGLNFYRHRAFETNWFWMSPGHPKHTAVILSGGSLGARARTITYDRPDGSVSTLSRTAGSHRSNEQFQAAANAMEIDWMSKSELSQAIPPAYSEYLGRQLLNVLERKEASA